MGEGWEGARVGGGGGSVFISSFIFKNICDNFAL